MNVEYSIERIKEIEDVFWDTIKWANENNFQLVGGEWGVRPFNDKHFFYPKMEKKFHWGAPESKVDLCGAVLLRLQPIPSENGCAYTLAQVLKVHVDFVDGFIHGFDMYDPNVNKNIEEFHSPPYVQGYEMGCDFLAAICKSTKRYRTTQTP